VAAPLITTKALVAELRKNPASIAAMPSRGADASESS
jgi:hypothetical protein